MPARVVPPLIVKAGSERPLDLEAELKQAATKAANGALDYDTLEELACIACEAAEGDPSEEEFRSAVEPVLESADEGPRDAVLQALWNVAKESSSSMKVEMPLIPVRSAPAKEEDAPRYQTRSAVDLLRAKQYLEERALSVQQEHMEEAKREIVLQEFYKGGSVAVEEETDAVSALLGSPKDPEPSDSEGSSSEEDELEVREREIIKRRLREIGEPVTFFGEDDNARFERLKQLELGRDQNELATGSTNVMQIIDRRMAREQLVKDDEAAAQLALTAGTPASASSVPLPKKQKKDPTLSIKDDMNPFDRQDALAALDDQMDEDEGLGDTEADRDIRTVLKWLRITLRSWETAITSRTPDESGASNFSGEKAHFRQSKQYLRPLRKSLREGRVNPSIVKHLATIAAYADKKQYREAKQAYMTLAIGNAAWPMGVNMVTFHDRPNRHNISEEASAHALDDETTRKYVQMVKRLLTFVESHSPIEPSLAA